MSQNAMIPAYRQYDDRESAEISGLDRAISRG
jgi:hypothetical protein